MREREREKPYHPPQTPKPKHLSKCLASEPQTVHRGGGGARDRLLGLALLVLLEPRRLLLLLLLLCGVHSVCERELEGGGERDTHTHTLSLSLRLSLSLALSGPPSLFLGEGGGDDGWD